jgi:hypothetical protein
MTLDKLKRLMLTLLPLANIKPGKCKEPIPQRIRATPVLLNSRD